MSPHVCCQVYKSTRYQVSVSNTVTEATGFSSTPTSIHKCPCSVSCHVPRCPTPSQHISHRMRPREFPQNTFSNSTTLGNNVCNDSISVECPPPVQPRGTVHVLCPIVVVASSPTSKLQLAALQRFKSTCCQSHAQPPHLRNADLHPSRPNDQHRAIDARFHLDPPGSISRSVVSRRSC